MPVENTVTGEAVDPARRTSRSAPTAAKPPPMPAPENGERRRAQDRLSDILILAQTVGQHGIQLAQQGERLDRLEIMSTQQGARLDTLDVHLTAQDGRHDTVVTSVNEVKASLGLLSSSLGADVEQGKAIAHAVQDVAGKVDTFLAAEEQKVPKQAKVNTFVEVMMAQRDEDLESRQSLQDALRDFTRVVVGGVAAGIVALIIWVVEQFLSQTHDTRTVVSVIAFLAAVVLVGSYSYLRWSASQVRRRLRRGSKPS